MYILGIGGSPRKGGNSDALLDNALLGAKTAGAKTEKVILADLSFSPCLECENAPTDGTCLVKDGMQPLYEKIQKCGALILASPIFFGSLTAQTKMMIDRFHCRWRYIRSQKSDLRSQRQGAFIAVEASKREDFFKNAETIVKNFFAAAGIQYKLKEFFAGVENKGDILKRPTDLKKAFDLGKELVLRCLA